MEDFWKTWSRDYLHSLQQPKWYVVQRLAKIGQIVLVRNPLTPLNYGNLVISRRHPRDDGRIFTIKTSLSEYKRSVVKLCFLLVAIKNIEEANEFVTAGGSLTYPMSPITRSLLIFERIALLNLFRM